MTLLSVVKWIGGPGSIGFLVTGLVIGIGLVRVARTRVFGRAWLVVLLAAYWILALPPVAMAVAQPFADDLAGRRPVRPGIDTLVVLHGDNYEGRIAEAIRLWSVAHPKTVIASGQPWFAERLREGGISRDRLIEEQRSRTTRDQIQYLKSYLTEHPNVHAALVASRLQMPRVAAMISRAGLNVALYGSRVDRELDVDGFRAYLPAYAALRISRDAFYERVALKYYRWRGWID